MLRVKKHCLGNLTPFLISYSMYQPESWTEVSGIPTKRVGTGATASVLLRCEPWQYELPCCSCFLAQNDGVGRCIQCGCRSGRIAFRFLTLFLREVALTSPLSLSILASTDCRWWCTVRAVVEHVTVCLLGLCTFLLNTF